MYIMHLCCFSPVHHCIFFEYSTSGVSSDSDPPDSIPHSAVKPVSADGTLLGRVGRCREYCIEKHKKSSVLSDDFLYPFKTYINSRLVHYDKICCYPLSTSDQVSRIHFLFLADHYILHKHTCASHS